MQSNLRKQISWQACDYYVGVQCSKRVLLSTCRNLALLLPSPDHDLSRDHVKHDTGDGDVAYDVDDESAGTEGSERMVAARDMCSGSELSSSRSGNGSQEEEEVLFLEDLDVADPSLPPPPLPPPVAPVPVPTPAGYVYTDPDDPRTCFGRLTTFRGQQAMRCYKHPGCSWILPRTSTISSGNLVRWAQAGMAAEVVTKEDHMRKRHEFS